MLSLLRPVTFRVVHRFVVICFLLFLTCCRWCNASPERTALDDYVNKPDEHYSYREVAAPFKGVGYTIYYLNMTSQQWLTDELVSPSIWWHWMAVTIPDELTYPTQSFLYITGGSNHDMAPPEPTVADVYFSSLIALTTGSVCATLFQVPNQPTVFSEDPNHRSRTEDAVIAFTWYHYRFHTDQPEYLLRMPMTKAAVRAMDTVEAFSAMQTGGKAKVSKFVVAGASKRGWTTWTTAAVDRRVVGAIPIVEDLLNAQQVLHHMYKAYGGWTFAFDDYLALNITKFLDDEETTQMYDIIDPIVYRDRLTMPKFVICTGGDEFFMPDDSLYFWNELKGEKYIRTVPNAEHSMTGHFISVMFAARAFILSVFQDSPRPKFEWTLLSDAAGGSIVVKTNSTPLTAEVWHATTLTNERRDFRLLVGPDPSHPVPQPVIWHGKTLPSTRAGVYVANMSIPDDGRWTAFFVQLTFAGIKDSVFEFTTQTLIIPGTFPFKDCHGAGCRGKLV